MDKQVDSSSFPFYVHEEDTNKHRGASIYGRLWCSVGIDPGVKELGPMAILFLITRGISKLISIKALLLSPQPFVTYQQLPF